MFQRFFDDGLAQSSYLLACGRTREAVVIDPRRDVDAYVDAARQHGLALRYAIDTHIHADFVSGSRELAAVGVRAVAGPGSALGFEHQEATDGEHLQVGDLRLTFFHTPGHTPEHICILVDQPGSPVRLFAGDTLFVGAVGRPDLLGEDLTRRLAGELYDSLFGKLLCLPDGVEVHPGHGAGSLCGAGIGSDPFTTIGQERRFNPMLQQASREQFVAAVLADLPETPPYFPRMKRINHAGPPLLGLAGGVPGVRALPPRAAAVAADEGAWIVDLRGADAHGASHPRGAVNLGFGSKVGYWAGWVLPAAARIVLLANSDADAHAAARQLLRVGLDHVEGQIAGGFDAWRQAGLPVAGLSQMTMMELRERIQQGDAPRVLDVRTAKEYQSGHIAGATSFTVGDIAARDGHAPVPGPLAVICEGGYRSSLAASLLRRAGAAQVVNVTGGMAAYRELEGTK